MRAVEVVHLNVDRDRRCRPVGNHGTDAIWIGRYAVPRRGADNCAVVGYPEQEDASFGVRQADHRLDQLVVVSLGLELDCQRLSATGELHDLLSFHESTITQFLYD